MNFRISVPLAVPVRRGEVVRGGVLLARHRRDGRHRIRVRRRGGGRGEGRRRVEDVLGPTHPVPVALFVLVRGVGVPTGLGIHAYAFGRFGRRLNRFSRATATSHEAWVVVAVMWVPPPGATRTRTSRRPAKVSASGGAERGGYHAHTCAPTGALRPEARKVPDPGSYVDATSSPGAARTYARRELIEQRVASSDDLVRPAVDIELAPH